ncbi:hypothetical protein ATCV1_z163L [Acanthocystis turfacea chlorella virus 1]|uniref:Uncharacterized protein z163L n=1 Tax=Chlorovirus heliozoae TaxID=322019 RepID=A7K8C3_9PHYC|nr:hypothetical protein ATCV1_z163L [Acanthocystis turfacea chlorella virus 1]ABT16297.1 hypothetical protein ATCV1_z163L [Acanthocystis turfacea chlorella virus 1]
MSFRLLLLAIHCIFTSRDVFSIIVAGHFPLTRGPNLLVRHLPPTSTVPGGQARTRPPYVILGVYVASYIFW